MKKESSKINSTLSKDINRMRKNLEKQIKMNVLRKHQINLLDKFFKKLIREKRITREELKFYLPKKKEAEKELFGRN
jgi:hypothetical protein